MLMMAAAMPCSFSRYLSTTPRVFSHTLASFISSIHPTRVAAALPPNRHLGADVQILQVFCFGTAAHPPTLHRPRTRRLLSSSTRRPAAAFRPTLPVLSMSSDKDYMDFLNKANKDPSSGVAQASAAVPQKHQFKTVDEGEAIPEEIRKVTTDRFYTSEADEPFVPVCLKWDEAGRELPDEESLAKLIGHDSPADAEQLIEIMDRMTWDPRGEYGDVIRAVEEATSGNPTMVYQIQHTHGSTRVEYWILSSLGLGKDAKLVGAKVLSLES